MDIYYFKEFIPQMYAFHVLMPWVSSHSKYRGLSLHGAAALGISSSSSPKEPRHQRRSYKQMALTYLTPYKHGTKHNLETIKKVVTNDDDHGSSCGPAFTWADGFDAGCS